MSGAILKSSKVEGFEFKALDGEKGKEEFIKIVQKHLFEDGSMFSRLIIQLWTKDQRMMREKYLGDLERTSRPTTKIIH